MNYRAKHSSRGSMLKYNYLKEYHTRETAIGRPS